MKIATKIRELRIQKNWTIEYVSSQVGTNSSTIQKIETGMRKPSFELLIKLLKLYDKPFYQDIIELFAVTDDNK